MIRGIRVVNVASCPDPEGEGVALRRWRSYPLSFWADPVPHPGTGHGKVKKGRGISE